MLLLFKTKTLPSLSCLELLNELTSGGGFVYRGQSDESWGLTSTYYRRFNLNKSGAIIAFKVAVYKL
jgi:hypothetical protein